MTFDICKRQFYSNPMSNEFLEIETAYRSLALVSVMYTIYGSLKVTAF